MHLPKRISKIIFPAQKDHFFYCGNRFAILDSPYPTDENSDGEVPLVCLGRYQNTKPAGAKGDMYVCALGHTHTHTHFG